MPKFVTIGYGDEAGYEHTSPDVRARAHEHDRRLLSAGAVVGIAGEPVMVRNPEEGGVRAVPGQFLTSPLPIAGFGLIEADSLEEAILLASLSPCAVAHGVVEVWPLLDPEQ